jgi:hypothetical protein
MSSATPRISVFGRPQGWQAAIVIPAKDEAGRIESCLDAVGIAIAGVPDVATGIVVVVNNTRDATADMIRHWAELREGGAPLILVDHKFPAAMAGVGHARALGLDIACVAMPGDGALLMTDADTHVDRTWMAENVSELRHADVICGRVDAIAEEQAALPLEISRHGSAESDYVAAALELAALLDPLPHDPRPSHHNGAGASLAVMKSVYRAVGGMPRLRVGEDRAFIEQAEAMDFRIRYSDRPVVRTSCRLTGRTEGGMAGALRERRDLADPPSDEWLEPAATFCLRHGLRGALRSVWPTPDRVRAVLQAYLGPEAATLTSASQFRHFGQFVQHVEARCDRLARVRMHQSDCRRELPHLRRLLAELRAENDEADHAPPLRRQRGGA